MILHLAIGFLAASVALPDAGRQLVSEDEEWTYSYSVYTNPNCTDAEPVATYTEISNEDGTTMMGHCSYRVAGEDGPEAPSTVYRCKGDNNLVFQYYAECGNCFCEVDDSFRLQPKVCVPGDAVGFPGQYLQLNALNCGEGPADPCFGRDSSFACLLRDGAARGNDAYDACFGERRSEVADRVLMRELVAGDSVLTMVAGAPVTTRVLLAEHRTELRSANVLTLHHEGGVLTLTPDHVIMVDGAFAPARTVRAGSMVTGAHGGQMRVSRVDAAQEGIINPITTAGTILAADARGEPLLASTYGEWIADWLLGAVWPLPLSCASALSFLFPASVQSYHDLWIEPLFLREASALKATKRNVPLAVVAMIVATLDVALAAGFVVFCCAAAPKLVAFVALATLAPRMRAKPLA